MGDSSASYIRVVQHLIEKCLLFNMTKEDCMEALFKHADIVPVITSTVWRELEKENEEFFDRYWRNIDNSSCTVEVMETNRPEMMIQKVMISSESSTDKDSQDSKD